jgi:hypothetical protein
MQPSVKKWLMAIGLAVLGLAIAAAGIFVGEYDDAPGGSLGGIVLGLIALTFAVRIALRKT